MIAESSPPGEDIRLASMPSPAKRGRREASVETDRESSEDRPRGWRKCDGERGMLLPWLEWLEEGVVVIGRRS